LHLTKIHPNGQDGVAILKTGGTYSGMPSYG
jgi:hypothetical protein